MIIEKKIKVKDLLILSFLFVLLMLFINAGVGLVGLFSLIFVSLITFCLSRYYKFLAIILCVALCVRLATIYLGNYLIVLPDSWGDATLFEQTAWKYSQDGFWGVFDNIQTDKTKYIVIFSDMFEFRDKRIPVTKANLKNFHVLVVCGGLINSEQNTANFCMNTQDTWKSEFKKLGAESVTFTIETGNWHQKTAKEFFSN